MSVTSSDARFARRVLIVAAIVLLGLLAWTLSRLLLLVFAAVLFAVLLGSIAQWLTDHLRLPYAISLLATTLALLGLVVGVFVLFGVEIRGQVGELVARVQEAWTMLRERVGGSEMAQQLREVMGSAVPSSGSVMATVASLATGVLAGIADLVLVLVGAIYFAAQPDLYRRGVALVMPPRVRPQILETLGVTGSALRLWLIGQLMSMVIVGLLTGVGLWLLDVPSALALGLLAGIAEFVPYIGPILAAVPALLIAVTVDPATALWTALLYLGVQQIESNVVMPLIARRMVELPPALTVFSVVAFGLVFGMPGLLLAAPLTVAVMVAVKMLWVREALHGQTAVPGEDEAHRPAAH